MTQTWKIAAIAALTGLSLTACNNKEKQLYEQIKAFPTQELINQYVAEYSDGEHADSVKNVYQPIVQKMQEMDASPNFRAYLSFGQQAVSDTLKAWAMGKAEPLLLDSLKKKPSAALCDIYMSTFPQSSHKAEVEAIKKKAVLFAKPTDAWAIHAYGPVKRIVHHNGRYNTNSTFNFTQAGRATMFYSNPVVKVVNFDGANCKLAHNSSGWLTSVTGWEWGMSFTYNTNGRVIKDENGGEGGYEYKSNYELNDDGLVTKETSREMDGYAEPMVTRVITYNNTELDRYGNWTRRTGSMKGKTFTDTRQIEYWE